MTYFYVLLITYGGVFSEFQSGLIYPDARSCGDAMEVIASTFHDEVPIDMMQCVETNQPSSSIRPKKRP